VIGGDLGDRGGEDRREVFPVVARQPAEQRAAEAVRVPGDSVGADPWKQIDSVPRMPAPSSSTAAPGTAPTKSSFGRPGVPALVARLMCTPGL
jgi:hypothetical protein